MTNALKGAALSFYSGTYYGELARFHKGIGAGLILVLTLITSLLMFLVVILGGALGDLRGMLESLPEKADTFPAVSFTDGKLSIDKPTPYKITLGAAPDETLIIIDPDYTVSDINEIQKYMREQKAIGLITADKMITRNVQQPGESSGGAIEIHDFRDAKPFVITHEKWYSLAMTLREWGMPMLAVAAFVTLTLALFIGNLIATLLTALAVMLAGLMLRTPLEFTAASRLAAAARIPITILSSLPVFAGLPPLEGLLGWALWALYVIFAVMAVRFYGGKRVV